MILEGLVTTLDLDGRPHLAPMGPVVDDPISQLVLRPYRTTRTFRHLFRTRQGVFHVTDDVELMALAAIHRLETLPPVMPAPGVEGVILQDACRWYAFRVTQLDDSNHRARIVCQVVSTGRIRDFIGFNRAKHAVIEAAILATRLSLLDPGAIRAEFSRLAVIVEKTAGEPERRAFQHLQQYVHEHLCGRG